MTLEDAVPTTTFGTRAARGAQIPYATVLVLIGGVLAAGGVKLVMLGGSPYYLPAGLAAAAAGLAVLLRRWRLASLIYLAMLVATAVWSLAEVGLDGWALAPRLLSPAVLGLPFFAVALFKEARGERLAALAVAAGAVVLISASAYQARFEPAGAHGGGETAVTADAGSENWPQFGGAPGGARYSRLASVTPSNVAGMQLAWSVRFGPLPRGPIMANQAVPIKVGDLVYTCTPWNHVIAIDPDTGATRWHFDPNANRTGIYQPKCRGVSYYAVPGASGPCAQRIFTATVDGRLIGLDAATGVRCASFGERGEVDLLKGMTQRSRGYYSVTSPPAVIRGKLVVGGSVSDGQYVGEPSGAVRAYDAVTGKLAWVWDIGRPGRRGELAPGEHYTSGTPNSWAPMSADEALGLVYVPTGAATPDFWGGHRSPESNRYGNSIVALDAETGELRWSFQTIHYDVWDYDVGSQPSLFDLRTPKGVVPALMQPTKRGQLFILDRRTGKPIFPVVERPAPQSGAVERLSATQPWSVATPDFSAAHLSETSMWGLTALDQLWCRIQFREARYQGPLTPPGVTPSIANPGFSGGMDWGSASVDAAHGLAILPSNSLANHIRLIPRSDPTVRGLKGNSSNVSGGPFAQEGSPFAAEVRPFLSPLVAPCQAPPYGRLNAVDLRTGRMVWSRPIGSARDLGPILMRSHLPFTMGTPTTGGALVTASGLVFIGATADHALRAFDSATGKKLFEANLPGSANSTPITYRSARNGRQYVVVSSEAPGKDGSFYGAISAWALPE